MGSESLFAPIVAVVALFFTGMATKICGEHVFDGKPTRTAGAKR